MTDRPILFSGPMVRAILDGRKTQTRRVIKWADLDEPQPGYSWADCLCPEIDPADTPCEICAARFGVRYEAGDLLWVKETWAEVDGRIVYRATEPDGAPKWKPSIFMPKKHARIWLDVVRVRAERMQLIAEEDAMAEGCSPAEATDGSLSYALGFSDLWDSLNAKRGYGWDRNPWVWVIEFRFGRAAKAFEDVQRRAYQESNSLRILGAAIAKTLAHGENDD